MCYNNYIVNGISNIINSHIAIVCAVWTIALSAAGIYNSLYDLVRLEPIISICMTVII